MDISDASDVDLFDNEERASSPEIPVQTSKSFYGSTSMRRGSSSHSGVPVTPAAESSKSGQQPFTGHVDCNQTPHGKSKQQKQVRRGTPSSGVHSEFLTRSCSNETPQLPSESLSRRIRKRDIFRSSYSDESSDSEEDTVLSKSSQKKKRSAHGDIQENLKEMKGMLKMFCEKVGKNERCLKELQNLQQSRLVEWSFPWQP